MSMRTDDVFAILSKRIDMQGATPSQIQEAVNKYLSENPVDSVTEENIKEALGYTPADQKDVTELNEKIVQLDGKFELIESFTTTEEITRFMRTAEPNGTPYDFQKLKVIVRQPSGDKVSYGGINCFKNSSNTFISSERNNAFNNTKMSYSQYNAYIDNGILKGDAITVTTTMPIEDINKTMMENAYVNSSICEPLFVIQELINMEKIEYLIYESLNGHSIPVGTQIDIYAVRS